MDPIPLNAVRAPAADVAADTAGTAVVSCATDIAGAAADARAALAGAAADNAVVTADAQAAVDLAGDLYRRACRVRRPLWPPLLALKPAVRAWLPSVPSKLLLISSTRTRPLSRSLKLNFSFKAKFRSSGACARRRPCKTRRLISCSAASIT